MFTLSLTAFGLLFVLLVPTPNTPCIAPEPQKQEYMKEE
jgi:hypothetical protein